MGFTYLERKNQSREGQEGKPTEEAVQDILKNPEPLLRLEDFGLTPDETLSRLARHMPNRYLDSDYRISGTERENKYKRIVYLPIEQIRTYPDRFYEYQESGVKVIAKLLRIPMDRNILVPMHRYILPEYQDTFRKQEQLIKNISDWNYLLLYPEVWKIFFECILPYCGLPPYQWINAYDKSGAVQDRRLVFAWNRPGNKKDQYWQSEPVFNDIPYLNYHVDDKVKLTVPGRVNKFIFEATEKGTPGIIHGLARTVYSGIGTELINQEDYMVTMPDQRNRIPMIDVDTFVLGDIDIPGVVRRIKRAEGNHINAGIALGRSMAGIFYGWFSKPQGKRDITPDDPRTFMTVLRAWMGRAVRQPTDSLALLLLTVPRCRSSCLWPELKKIHGSYAFALKPEDIYGGLMDLLQGPVINEQRRVNITAISWEDMLPQNQPMAYWMMFRIFSDTVWQKGVLPWNTVRAILQRLFDQWPTVKARMDLEVQVPDLRHDAQKAFIKALNDNPSVTMLLMTESLTADGYEGIGMMKFYPNIHKLSIKQDLWFKLLEKLKEKPENIIGSLFFINSIRQIQEFMIIITQELGDEIDDQQIMEWVGKTIF